MPYKQLFHTAKIYAQGAFNLILIIVGWVADNIDPILRATSIIAGIVLTIVLIFKAVADIRTSKLNHQLKKLELEKKNQELAEIILANKRKNEKAIQGN